ncbi:ABC transporter substrate-binding protein [Xanthobacter sp. YC-JY1]|uniref:ABC transporter substrate-binding protein n=1 Tax=Xanthobacter sp. YC-JY1 TaxID=2419844 RepID=UPI001F46B677|nr:ABC transporter substrate-binding protein [Xanthobacter sp. YC-JY1]UJX46086.1 ABC transporter substrate-binding protein [Xanthobacter sp. YC-JY1]
MLAALLACASAGAQEPRVPLHARPRVVSLNLCTDELALRLADPGQVLSVTHLARDPLASNVADRAREVPVNRGLAEEVVPLKPDLVLVGAYTTRTATAVLRRLGFEVLELGDPQTLEEAYAQIRMVAERLGVPERGAAMVRQMEEAFARLPPVAGPRPTAVVLRPNGFTTGRGSLADELMEKAGLSNLAARLPTDKMGQLALEEIVRAAPDLVVVNAEETAPPSLADALLHHPALAPFKDRTLALPLRLWTCAGPDLAEAAVLLAAARARLSGPESRRLAAGSAHHAAAEGAR